MTLPFGSKRVSPAEVSALPALMWMFAPLAEPKTTAPASLARSTAVAEAEPRFSLPTNLTFPFAVKSFVTKLPNDTVCPSPTPRLLRAAATEVAPVPPKLIG